MTINNDLPNWFGIVIKIGSVVVALALGWATLSARVDATNLIANNNTTSIATTDISVEENSDQITEIRLIQVKVTTVLEGILKSQKEQSITMKEIQKDIRDHSRETP